MESVLEGVKKMRGRDVGWTRMNQQRNGAFLKRASFRQVLLRRKLASPDQAVSGAQSEETLRP